MKNTLMFLTIASLAIITASVSSYYVIILPRQNIQNQEDISAIRGVIAPTPEQQKAQQLQNTQNDKAFIDYSICQNNMADKSRAYLQQQCPDPFLGAVANQTNPFDPTIYEKHRECTTKVMSSIEYKKFTCPKPF